VKALHQFRALRIAAGAPDGDRLGRQVVGGRPVVAGPFDQRARLGIVSELVMQVGKGRLNSAPKDPVGGRLSGIAIVDELVHGLNGIQESASQAIGGSQLVTLPSCDVDEWRKDTAAEQQVAKYCRNSKRQDSED
jgi:hypothetical protein